MAFQALLAFVFAVVLAGQAQIGCIVASQAVFSTPVAIGAFFVTWIGVLAV